MLIWHENLIGVKCWRTTLEKLVNVAIEQKKRATNKNWHINQREFPVELSCAYGISFNYVSV